MLIGRIARAGDVVFVRPAAYGLVAIENPYLAFAERRRPADLGAVEGGLLAPSAPVLLLGLAQNGPGHPSPVQAWLKSPRGIVPAGFPVTLRRDAGMIVAEGEIAVVIGRSTEGLTAANAHEYVLGVTAVNDLSSPDRAVHDPRNFESKSGSGYTPLGPWIDTDADIDTVDLSIRVDDRTIATTDATALPVSIRDSLAYVAHWAPLGPGDVIMTGAPFTQAPIEPGARVEIRVGRVSLHTQTR